MGRHAVTALLLGGLSLGGCMGSAPPTPTVRLDPLRVPTPGGSRLGAVGFMAGCWRTPPGPGAPVLEERWSPPEDGVMLGTSRFVRDGRVVSFEFGLIQDTPVGVSYLPHPGGTASEHAFHLVASAPGEARFEAPDHDYPKRIAYRRTPGGLQARIDAGADDPDPRVWEMEPVACH